jgi:hypothetical protein
LRVPTPAPTGCSLSKLAVILAFAVLVAGCGMAGPGVARSQPAPPPGTERETFYDSRWVKPREPDAINTLNPQKDLSVNISERKLGVRYLDENSKIGDKTVPAYEKRQHDREKARRKAWQARMGLKTVKSEQDEKAGGKTKE